LSTRSKLPVYITSDLNQIEKVEKIKIGNNELKIIVDNGMPENEIHFVQGKVCVGKIINASS